MLTLNRALALASMLAILLAPGARAAEVPASIDDLCPAAEDPCIIDEAWDVAGGINLDFGTRTVRMVDNGRLDLGESQKSLACGSFEIEESATSAIALTGPLQFEKIDGGKLYVYAYRTCADAPATRCLSDAGCPSGACSLGSGDINIAGGVRGNASDRAELVLNAAGRVDISGKIVMNGIHPPPDEFTIGGDLRINATDGPVVFTGKLSAKGSDRGGDVVISTGGEVTLDGHVRIDGGFTAGSVTVTAGGRVNVDGRIASNGKGVTDSEAGTLSISAGDDVTLGADKLRLSLRGGQRDTIGGDLLITTPASITLASASRLDLRGGYNAYSFGGRATLNAGAGFLMDGRLTLSSDGEAGELSIVAATVDVGADARIDASASPGEGGQIDINGLSAVELDGTIAADGTSIAGGIHVTTTSLSVAGSLGISGNVSSTGFEIDACDATFLPGSSVEVGVPGAGVLATVSEALRVEADATITAPATGSHVFEYRSDGPAPVVIGEVTPAPTLTPIAALPCP